MRRRLVLITLASTTTIALAFVLPLAVLVRDVAEERALLRGRQVATAVAPTLLTGDREALQVALAGADRGLTTSVVRSGGDVLGAPLPPGVDLGPAFGGAAYTVATDDADVLVTPVIRPDRGTAVVVVSVPEELQRRGVAAAWGVLAALAVVLVGGTVALADRLGRSVTGPAAEVTETARRLGRGDLAARATAAGPPEVADIARALNALADRIDALVVREREAVADLSHRLRTPMTALRLDVDAVPDPEARARLTADLDELERSVDRLIRDARAGTAAGAARDEIADAAEVVRQRAAWWAALAEDQGRTATVDLGRDHLHVPVERSALEDAVDALIGNVFAHTPEGTAYTVGLMAVGGEGTIEVSDQGPGLASGAGQRRGDSAAGSTGLGLDIARRVAEEAGGRLELGSGRGGGARVALVLPEVGPRGGAGGT